MFIRFTIFSIFFVVLSASELTLNEQKLVKKGHKIATIVCNEQKLLSSQIDTIHLSIEQIGEAIIQSQSCPKLSKSKLKAVSYYLLHHTHSPTTTRGTISVPTNAKCPVCGMFVHKYPKWAGMIVVSGEKFYFDGVKDMMKYYIFDVDFPYSRNSIESILVTNFYTLESIDAKSAYYVIGSNMYGPMGNELIPFTTQKEAKNFMLDHKGEKIVRFGDITPKMVMALDGVEYE